MNKIANGGIRLFLQDVFFDNRSGEYWVNCRAVDRTGSWSVQISKKDWDALPNQ